MTTCHALSLVQEDMICRNPVTMTVDGQPYCRTHGEMMKATDLDGDELDDDEDE